MLFFKIFLKQKIVRHAFNSADNAFQRLGPVNLVLFFRKLVRAKGIK